MSKTDKLLYGGFAIVAFAGIVAMLVSVFAPPQQPAEETAKNRSGNGQINRKRSQPNGAVEARL